MLDREVYVREHSLAMYQQSAYYLSNLLIDIPTSIVSAALWTLISYPTMPLRMELPAFLIYFLVTFWNIDFHVAMAESIATVADSLEFVMGCICTILGTSLMFGGLAVRPSEMPLIVYYIYLVAPSHYFATALVVNEFAYNSQYALQGLHLLDTLDMVDGENPTSLSWLVFVSFAQWAVMRCFAYFILSVVEHRKR